LELIADLAKYGTTDVSEISQLKLKKINKLMKKWEKEA